MDTQQTFLPFEVEHGLLAEFSADPLPSRLVAWSSAETELPGDGTHFGFAYTGGSTLVCSRGELPLGAGMYFALPESGRIVGEGSGIVVTRIGERALFHLGGPVEDRGRLRYIDGCTDNPLDSADGARGSLPEPLAQSRPGPSRPSTPIPRAGSA